MPVDELGKKKDKDIDSFSGGINSSVPAHEIADNEAVEILNMEFDDAGNLSVRKGVNSEMASSLWDVDLWDSSYWTSTGTTYSKRITSILDYINDSGFVGIIYTTGTKVFSRTLDGSSITDITGVFVLPDDVRWYWRILNGIAIGVNGITTTNNPMKVSGAAPGTLAVLGGSPPKAKFIEVWNSRVWVVKADQPNQIQASDLGDPESWNVDGQANPSHGAVFEINKNDGDQITGLYATKERLFVFKRNSIHVVFPENPNLPKTDIRNIAINVYTDKLGCLSQTSIQQVFDDLIFLTDGGIASLSASQIVADFESALISRKLKNVGYIAKNIADEDVCSFILKDRSQYWLCVARVSSPEGKNITYVLDYRELKNGVIRWVLFDKLAFGTSIEVYDHDVADLVYLLGCNNESDNTFFIGKYTPKTLSNVYVDGLLAYSKVILTKSYNLDKFNVRKFFHEWSVGLISITTDITLSVHYFFDDRSDTAGTYSFVISSSAGGALFDSAIFDTSAFDQLPQTLSKLIRRKFLQNDSGKKALLVQFKFLNGNLNEGYSINNFSFEYSELSKFKAGNV